MSSQSQYGTPIDKTSMSYRAFISKKWFKPSEFACLLAEVDPQSFDGSYKSYDVYEVKVAPYVRLIEEHLEEIDDFDCPF